MLKKRTFCVIGFILLAISLLAFLFSEQRTQVTEIFIDVSEKDYFYSEVIAMYDQGIISGYGNDEFLPYNAVKHAEALKLICTMAGVDFKGYSGKSEPWYSDVVFWAQDKGIIAPEIDPEAFATRDDICSYIVSVYKLDTSVTDTNVFSDTDSKVVNTLYDLGVINGLPNSDGTVSFGGAQNVKRCDTCIILFRLGHVAQPPDWTEGVKLDKSHYNISRPYTLSSYDDYVAAWRYMLVNVVFNDSYQLKTSCSKEQLDNMMRDIQNAYHFASFDYMEYSSFLNQWEVAVSYSLDKKGNCIDPTISLTLKNGFGLSETEISQQIEVFEITCDQIVTDMYIEGSLNEDMSVKEKAFVLFAYVTHNMKYDTTYSYYNGYDAVVRGTAVCQGYTAMYNYLCNIAGVNMRGMSGTTDEGGHAWSRIYYNGSFYNIDCTWADPIPDRPNYFDETWFWVADDFLKTCANSRTFDIDNLVYG